MTDFTLDKRLDNDCHFIADLKLSRVLLMNNRLFPWVVLVPRINDVAEITDLSYENQHILTDETSQISTIMQNLYQVDKMNIAALGNIVRQLHIHIIARFENDKAWANPVWGGESESYDSDELEKVIEKIRKAII